MAIPDDSEKRLSAIAAAALTASEKATAKGDYNAASLALFAFERAQAALRLLDSSPPRLLAN